MTTQFVLAVFANTWVHELRDMNYLYTKVVPKELFSHLQAGCTGRHTLDLLALHNEMQRYHLHSWDFCGAAGWYVGVSLQHYQCHTIVAKATRAAQISDTVEFRHHHLTQPEVTPMDRIVHGVKNSPASYTTPLTSRATINC